MRAAPLLLACLLAPTAAAMHGEPPRTGPLFPGPDDLPEPLREPAREANGLVFSEWPDPDRIVENVWVSLHLVVVHCGIHGTQHGDAGVTYDEEERHVVVYVEYDLGGFLDWTTAWVGRADVHEPEEHGPSGSEDEAPNEPSGEGDGAGMHLGMCHPGEA